MKCFIHQQKDAVGACKICGKAMCVDCSAYTSHTGICPECRRIEYIGELNAKQRELEAARKSVVYATIWMVIIAVAAILGAAFIAPAAAVLLALEIFFVVRLVTLKKKMTPLTQRIEWLSAEINSLQSHLNVGNAQLKF